MIFEPETLKRKLAKTGEIEKKICPPLPGIQPGRPDPAAVLIPILREGGEWKLLFIKRTRQPDDRHSGQVAFPGGRADAGDRSLLDTALREAREEIGTDPDEIEILGQSCSITTVTNYKISPFVGILPWPYPLSLSPEEVQKTFTMPLDWLNDPGNRRQEAWQSRSLPGVDLPVIFFKEYQGEVLWGATAQIVVDLLDIMGDSP